MKKIETAVEGIEVYIYIYILIVKFRSKALKYEQTYNIC